MMDRPSSSPCGCEFDAQSHEPKHVYRDCPTHGLLATKAEREHFADLIERSSLGTPNAKMHRRRTQRELGIVGAQRAIDEAHAYEHERELPIVDFPRWYRFKMVRAYPVISEVPDAYEATHAEIDAGFGRCLENRNLRRTHELFLDSE